MANVDESRTFEGVSEGSDFGVTRNEPGEPVVCDADGGNLLPFAAVFKARFAENSHLADRRFRIQIGVRRGEELMVMQEHNSHTANSSFVDSYRELEVRDHLEIVNVFYSSGVLSQIACLTLSVSLVVRGNHNDFLALLGESDRKLIDHDTKTSDSGPAAQLRRAENNRAKRVGISNELSLVCNVSGFSRN